MEMRPCRPLRHQMRGWVSRTGRFNGWLPSKSGVKVEQVAVDPDRTLPTSAERLALILNRNEPGHRLPVFGNDDAGVMVGYVVEGL